jgi:hypothetical protein
VCISVSNISLGLVGVLCGHDEAIQIRALRTVLQQESYMVLQECYKSVTIVLQECYIVFTLCGHDEAIQVVLQ